MLTKSKLTPLEMQIFYLLLKRGNFFGDQCIPIGVADRITLVKKDFDGIYKNKVICISRGVNLLSVSTAIEHYLKACAGKPDCRKI